MRVKVPLLRSGHNLWYGYSYFHLHNLLLNPAHLLCMEVGNALAVNILSTFTNHLQHHVLAIVTSTLQKL